MSGLYTPAILRRAVAVADYPLLADPDIRQIGQAAPCGSRLTLDLDVDETGRIAMVGLALQACAIGQAAAALFAQSASGRSGGDIAGAAAALERWLGAADAPLPDWPGIADLAPVRAHSARHGAALLPFRTAAAALTAIGAADTHRSAV